METSGSGSSFLLSGGLKEKPLKQGKVQTRISTHM